MLASCFSGRVWVEEEEEGVFKAKAMNEVDAGRDRATPASVRHDEDGVEGECPRPPLIQHKPTSVSSNILQATCLRLGTAPVTNFVCA